MCTDRRGQQVGVARSRGDEDTIRIQFGPATWWPVLEDSQNKCWVEGEALDKF